MIEKSKIKVKWTVRRKLLIGFASLIGLIMVVVMPGLFWQLHAINDSFHAFADALIAKDYVRAYDCTATELRSVTDFNAFVKVHEDLVIRMGELKGAEVSESESKELSDGWWANLNVRMVFARGSLFFTFVMKKENGYWKIYSYHEQ